MIKHRAYKVWYTTSHSAIFAECVWGVSHPNGLEPHDAERMILELLHHKEIPVEWVSVVRMQEQQPTLTDHIADCAIGVLSVMRRVFVK